MNEIKMTFDFNTATLLFRNHVGIGNNEETNNTN